MIILRFEGYSSLSSSFNNNNNNNSQDPKSELPTFKIVYFSENMRLEVDNQVKTFDWLLTQADPRGIRDLLKYNDFAYRQMWSPPYGLLFSLFCILFRFFCFDCNFFSYIEMNFVCF